MRFPGLRSRNLRLDTGKSFLASVAQGHGRVPRRLQQQQLEQALGWAGFWLQGAAGKWGLLLPSKPASLGSRLNSAQKPAICFRLGADSGRLPPLSARGRWEPSLLSLGCSALLDTRSVAPSRQ